MIIVLLTAFVFALSLTVHLLTRYGCHDGLSFCSALCAVIFGAVLFIMSLMCIGENALSDHWLLKWQAKREALVYQVEHDLYLGDAIGQFNSDLVGAKDAHNSPWTNWFVGDYVEQLEPIELEVSEDA